MQRVRSGNPQLDDLLGGGFPARAIHIVMGPPGSGKTILVEQLAFAAPPSDRPVLYVTTLSEPASKFITFLQQHTFGNVDLIGQRVIYENIAEEVSASPERIHEPVLRLIQEHRPSIIIIDSFKALSDLQSSMAAWRRVLYDLAGLLSAYDTTTFWVGEYSAEVVSKLPEFAVADGIVELTREQHGTSDERRFRVVKLRGSGFRDGYHVFRITPAGLEIFPRLVSPTVARDYVPVAERLRSGIGGLDEMIEQGWLRGTSTLVAGPSGSGKTMLSLHFLHEGVRGGEATLLVTFQENPTQLARIMKNIGWDPEELLAPGRLEVLYTSPVEMPIDTIVPDLFARLRARGIRRVVVDAVSDLERSARDPVRYRDFLYALTQYFALEKVTSMFTLETRGPIQIGELGFQEILNLTDNTLSLEIKLGLDLERRVRIMKSRGSAHDGRAHRLRIGADGIIVEEAPAS